MLNKKLEELTSTVIESLVAQEISESRVLDFKASAPGRKDHEKKEFLADISSFANASGGHILYGVEEARDENGQKTAMAGAAKGLAVNADEQILWMESLVRDGIAPRIPHARFRSITGFKQGPVIVVEIRKSWLAPHMVTLQGSSRFYSRNSAGKYPLDVGEIRSAFLATDQIAEKVRRFRFERVDLVASGESALSLSRGPRVILHVVPLDTLDASIDATPGPLAERRSWPLPLGGGGANWRYNVDGALGYNEDREGLARSYIQIFSRGTIETVQVEEPSGWFASVAFEKNLIRATNDYFLAMKNWGVAGPVVLMLSLTGVKGYFMGGPEQRAIGGRGAPIDRDTIIVPDVSAESLDAAGASVLRPALDTVWRACGFAGSPYYADNGEWVG